MRRALRQVLDQDLAAAERELAGVVRDDTDHDEAWLALARLYRLRGEIGRAIRIHQNLLLKPGLDPTLKRHAQRGLAADFRRGGFLQRAIAAYEELLAANRNDVEALSALVALHADARGFERALELEKRLARLEKRDGRAEQAALRVREAEAAHAEGRTEDALRALKKALKRDPKNADAWLQLGTLEAELGRSKRALAAWAKVAELDPASAAAAYPRLESAYAALDRGRDYERFLAERLESRPDDGAARLALAQALASRGETEGALAAVRRVLERDPDDLRAHRARARVLLAAGHEQEAQKALQELLDALERRGAFAEREPLG